MRHPTLKILEALLLLRVFPTQTLVYGVAAPPLSSSLLNHLFSASLN
jgi:hypothetical protein